MYILSTKHAREGSVHGDVVTSVRKGAHSIGIVELLASPSAESTGAVAPTLERRDSIGRIGQSGRDAKTKTYNNNTNSGPRTLTIV